MGQGGNWSGRGGKGDPRESLGEMARLPLQLRGSVISHLLVVPNPGPQGFCGAQWHSERMSNNNSWCLHNTKHQAPF